jgi:hypothetical protein
MGLTIATSQVALDAALAAGDFFAWSVNGTSETANLARTAVAAWTAASAADPSVKSNNGALTSAAVITGQTIVTHFAVYSASTAGTQKVDWQALDTPRTLQIGDTLTIAANALKVTLT